MTGMGHLEIVKALASFAADVNMPMVNGSTPVFIAAAMGHDGVTLALVSLGADVNVRRGDRTWARHCVEEFHVDPNEDGDWTPLMIAARNGHAKVVKVLMEAGASTGVMLSDGRTALSLAAAMGHADVVSILAAV
jgi:cytohesin